MLDGSQSRGYSTNKSALPECPAGRFELIKLTNSAFVCFGPHDPPEYLTLIHASRFLTANYSCCVLDTSARQRQFFVILIGLLPLW